MDILDRSGKPILDWRDWTRPMSKDGHWRGGRSAMELARAWFTSPSPITPPEIATLLQTSPLTHDLVLRTGWPERKTALPFSGEGRNHDLVMLGEANGKSILLAVEGKVDESLGPPIGHYWRKSKNTSRSRGWRRVDSLLESAFGPAASAEAKPWNELPYQMLTATVGTAIEASRNGCEIGVLCIHEFVTESAKQRSLDRNKADFTSFLEALGQRKPVAGKLYGPFSIATSKDGPSIRVLIGKVQYRWAAR